MDWLWPFGAWTPPGLSAAAIWLVLVAYPLTARWKTGWLPGPEGIGLLHLEQALRGSGVAVAAPFGELRMQGGPWRAWFIDTRRDGDGFLILVRAAFTKRTGALWLACVPLAFLGIPALLPLGFSVALALDARNNARERVNAVTREAAARRPFSSAATSLAEARRLARTGQRVGGPGWFALAVTLGMVAMAIGMRLRGWGRVPR